MDELLVNGISQLSTPVLIVMVVAVVNVFFKSTPHVRDWMIPFLSVLLGAALYVVAEGAVPSLGRNILVGLALGCVPVGGHQMWKQWKKEKTKGGEWPRAEGVKPPRGMGFG